ncbi:hypothetical protein C5D09_06315 [Rathayibacter sp. AY1C9]|uniref:hypothetical protein n=1 Tax=Rathayibacter sp. AY1C9 TaxID=2080541 RepID=UPI000CE859AF|nr:hypothetical protein [Rathayibacter sp. AY1C9]PPH46990.1 hypothetical protein C5D09_06315 [Rathayibacter sp. AY1C9]
MLSRAAFLATMDLIASDAFTEERYLDLLDQHVPTWREAVELICGIAGFASRCLTGGVVVALRPSSAIAQRAAADVMPAFAEAATAPDTDAAEVIARTAAVILPLIEDPATTDERVTALLVAAAQIARTIIRSQNPAAMDARLTAFEEANS